MPVQRSDSRSAEPSVGTPPGGRLRHPAAIVPAAPTRRPAPSGPILAPAPRVEPDVAQRFIFSLRCAIHRIDISLLPTCSTWPSSGSSTSRICTATSSRSCLASWWARARAVSFGSLYPALARLEKAGAVKAVEADAANEPAIPMTGAAQRRAGRLPRPHRPPGPQSAAPRRCTASPRSAGNASASCCSTSPPPTTAPSPCRWRSAEPCPRPSASACSSSARPSSTVAWPSAGAPAEGRTDLLPHARSREHEPAHHRPRPGLARRADRRRARSASRPDLHRHPRRPTNPDDTTRPTPTPEDPTHEHHPLGHRRRRQLRQLPHAGPRSTTATPIPADEVPGLMHVELGGYHIRDIEVVAAFDVDADKVGLDVGKAIWAGQNNTIKFAEVGDLGVQVQRGPTLDGFGKYYRQTCEESPAPAVDVAQALRDAQAPTCSSPTCRWAPKRRRSTTPRLPRRRRGLRERHPGVHRQRPRVGRQVHRRPACRSWVTTSRARWAPPSSTASWPACSRTGAWCSTAPTSSTWAATWTSRTCSSVSASSPRRSPRPRR